MIYDLGDTMSNLASAYSCLGRYQDALVMGEKALEFKRRVLPENHPDIGSVMTSLADTYVHLGRYQDALALGEQTLEFRRRVLPANHPDIGAVRFLFC